jgi:F-type H+-transporting ATPase subunit gamma
MSNIQALNRRIKTAKNIKQITKAMEMVSASKMRRAQGQAISSRPFSRKLYSTLQTIATLTDPSQHPLLQTSEVGKDLIVLVSTDKSLAGSLNTNLFRGTHDILVNNFDQSNLSFVIVGQKARYFVLSQGYDLYAEFTHMPDPLRFQDSVPLSSMLMKGFLTHEFRSVTLIYMDFVSTLVQKVRPQPLLPLSGSLNELVTSQEEAMESVQAEKTVYVFEPSAKSILNWLLPYYVELAVFQTLLESKASEHSARMVAMKNASDNAGDIIGDLTLSYNKQRQAKITNELLDNATSNLIVAN